VFDPAVAIAQESQRFVEVVVGALAYLDRHTSIVHIARRWSLRPRNQEGETLYLT
jgi:hypothetical protein